MNKLDKIVRFIVVLYMTVTTVFGWHAVLKDDESVKGKRDSFSEADENEDEDSGDYFSEDDSVDLAFDAAFDAAKEAVDSADLKGLLLDMIGSDYNSWDAKEYLESKLRMAVDNNQLAISEAKDLRRAVNNSGDPDKYSGITGKLSRKIDEYITHKATELYNEAKFNHASSSKK